MPVFSHGAGSGGHISQLEAVSNVSLLSHLVLPNEFTFIFKGKEVIFTKSFIESATNKLLDHNHKNIESTKLSGFTHCSENVADIRLGFMFDTPKNGS